MAFVAGMVALVFLFSYGIELLQLAFKDGDDGPGTNMEDGVLFYMYEYSVAGERNSQAKINLACVRRDLIQATHDFRMNSDLTSIIVPRIHHRHGVEDFVYRCFENRNPR